MTHFNDQRELPLSYRGADGRPEAPADRLFEPGSKKVSDLPEVRLMVERLVADAVEVLRLREEERLPPQYVTAVQEAASQPEPPAQEYLAKERAAAAAHARPRKPRHEELLDGMVETVREAFGRRQASALAQSIEAMSLSDENMALAGLLRHAFDIACSSPRIEVDLVRELSVCNEEAVLAGLYINAEELGKRLRKPALRRRQRYAQAACHGHVFIMAVNFEPADEELSADPYLINLNFEELANVAAWVANGMSQDRGGPVQGAYILPRLFTHEELADLGMQELHDLPERILRRARVNPEDLPRSEELLIEPGEADEFAMADVPLLGRGRVLYLVGVTWTDDPKFATGMRHLWQNGLPPEQKKGFVEALAFALDEKSREWDGTSEEATVSCATGEFKVAVVGCDLFFFALRSGAQYQRGQVFIQNLGDALEREGLEPEGCFFVVTQTRAPGLPLCPALRVYGAWMEEVAELPWPLLTFEGMTDQKAELRRLATALGMRPREEVTMVSNEGLA